MKITNKIVASVAISLPFSAAVIAKTTEKSAPNIVFILADDLGYGDLSCYGSQSIATPNIDEMARQGIKFTHCYAGSAVSSPSRACMLTGKFPLRYNIRHHFDDREMHLQADAVTIPMLLKQANYTSIHIGKWHLGGLRLQDFENRNNKKAALPGPLEHGFDSYLCGIEDPLIRAALVEKRELYRRGGEFLVANDKRLDKNPKHGEDIKTDEAIRVIEKYSKQHKPFFLNLWFEAPHTPYEPVPEPHYSKYVNSGATGDQLLFRSMVSHLDANVGKILKKLKELGIEKNTIVVFTSDNGPAYQGSPGPFRGGKTDLHEGGIRVPCIIQWKGHVISNLISQETIHFADFMPTFSHLAGADDSKVKEDGIDISNYLLTQIPLKKRTLCFQMDLYKEYQNQGPKPFPYATTVIIENNWKLLGDSIKPLELFNLGNDHREIYNLLNQNPEIQNNMQLMLNKFWFDPRK